MVLLYHKISDVKTKENNLAVSPEIYAEHLAFLSKKYRIFSSVLEWESSKESGILLTFDDGYFNNLVHALPIHTSLNVPFTLFTTTHWLQNQEGFWWELAYGQNNEKLAYNDVVKQLMPLPLLSQKIEFLARLGIENVLPLADENRPMTLDELKMFANSSLVNIGSHTDTHPRLALLSKEMQINEMQTSKQFLEEQLGKKVELISYPHGGKTAFNQITKAAAAEAGYSHGFAAYSGSISTGFDRYEIPRVHVGNLSVKELNAKIRQFL